MDYRTLGRTGVKVSALAMGTDNFSDTPNNMHLFCDLQQLRPW